MENGAVFVIVFVVVSLIVVVVVVAVVVIESFLFTSGSESVYVRVVMEDRAYYRIRSVSVIGVLCTKWISTAGQRNIVYICLFSHPPKTNSLLLER